MEPRVRRGTAIPGIRMTSQSLRPHTGEAVIHVSSCQLRSLPFPSAATQSGWLAGWRCALTFGLIGDVHIASYGTYGTCLECFIFLGRG